MARECVERGISPVGKEKVYGENDLPKTEVLSSETSSSAIAERPRCRVGMVMAKSERL